MSRITEKRDVQDQLINYLSGSGWSFIPRDDLPAGYLLDEQGHRSRVSSEKPGCSSIPVKREHL